jgi:hypothetical protein
MSFIAVSINQMYLGYQCQVRTLKRRNKKTVLGKECLVRSNLSTFGKWGFFEYVLYLLGLASLGEQVFTQSSKRERVQIYEAFLFDNYSPTVF